MAAAVTLPMLVPAIKGLGVVAAGAVTGAITGAGGALLQGGNLKDALKVLQLEVQQELLLLKLVKQ